MRLSMVPGQEFMDVPADHPSLLMLSDVAARHDVMIDVHFDLVVEDIPRPDYLSGDNPPVLKRNLDAFEDAVRVYKITDTRRLVRQGRVDSIRPVK